MSHESETAPVDDEHQQVTEYCGRTYQSYALRNQTYFAPIDEDEIDLLDALRNDVLDPFLDHRLVLPNPEDCRLRTALDLGCGTGNWALAFAEEFPEVQVLGLDASWHMMVTDDIPDNLTFEIEDHNLRFRLGSRRFDLINSQFMNGGIDKDRWKGYIKDIFLHLNRGGWCQMVEMHPRAQSDNGTLPRDGALSRWSDEYLEAIQTYKNPRAGRYLDPWMRERGFNPVESRRVILPVSDWPARGVDKAIRSAMSGHIGPLLYSMGLYPITRLRGMPLADFEALVEEATAEARNPRYKVYFELLVALDGSPDSVLPASSVLLADLSNRDVCIGRRPRR